MRENPIGRLLHTTFGVRGTQNLLSWAVAGGLAYYFFYLPEQRKKEERQALFDATRQRHADRLASVADRQKAAADVAQQQSTDLQN